MLFIISPAKTLDYTSEIPSLEHTEPTFTKQAEQLISHLKTLPQEEIGSLMKISEKLSELNVKRYQSWKTKHTPSDACRQAILAFKGDVYQGLDTDSWKKTHFTKAQKQLRILSGLYGSLRPLDLLHPYRLEMGTKLAFKKNKNLYEFWGEQVTESINSDLAQLKKPCLVNLASNEYYSVIKPKLIKAPIITPDFKDWKNGNYKVISFYAKKARGMMVKWALQENIKQSEDLKNFDVAGYKFDREMSADASTTTNTKLIFTRKQE